MRWNWDEGRSDSQLLYGSILFQIFVPVSTKIQTIWIVQIRKKFGKKECNHKLAAKDRIECLSKPREGQGNSQKAKLASVSRKRFVWREAQKKNAGKTLRAWRIGKLLEFEQNAREIIPLLHSSPFDSYMYT